MLNLEWQPIIENMKNIQQLNTKEIKEGIRMIKS